MATVSGLINTGTTTLNSTTTVKGPIYFGSAVGSEAYKPILVYSETYPQYGICYNNSSVDKLTFSASGNAGSADADLCINGNGNGTVTIRGNTIWHAGNLTNVSLLNNDSGYLTSLPTHDHNSAYMRVIEQNSTFAIDAIPNDLAPGVHKIHISGKEYSSILCGNDYTGALWLLYFHPHASYDLAIKYRYRDGAWRTILDSTNSSVSKEGETLTVTINGTSQSLTNSTYNFSGASFTSGQSNTGEHNCDNIKTNGHWYYSSNGPTTALGATTTDGALYTQAYSTSWVAQIAQDYRNGNLYTRSHKGDNSNSIPSGWQPWRKVAYTGEAQPASDVYDWAKAATKPSYAFNEITPGNAIIGDGANYMAFRSTDAWRSGMYYHTNGDESMVFANTNNRSSWMFVYGDPASRPLWTEFNGTTRTVPSLQIRNQCVTINKLMPNTGSATSWNYNLDVGGKANATELYENGTRVSVSGHAHDYLPLTGGTLTGTTTISRSDATMDAMLYATRTDLSSGTSIGFGIGTSNNRGIYDAKAGGWILKVDTSNKVTFSGTAYCSDRINVTATSLKETFYIPFVDALSGSRTVNVNSSLQYDPSTSTLTATTFSGNATSATQLATARTITLGTAVTATATSFNGTSNITIPVTKLYLGYLDWGGKSLSGEVSPIGCALSNEHNANRLAFLSSNAIDITTSSNGGSSYSAYSITAANKQQLVTTSSTVNIGPTTVATTGRTRILLGANGTGTSFSQQYVYTSPKKLLLNITTNGHGVSVLIEYATGAAPTTYSTLGTYALSGWSGWNDIPLNGISRFGGSATQATQVWYIRLTFMVTSVSASYANTPPLVLGIRMYGDNLWRAPSTMSQTGHLYSFDISQNATFPAKVNAVSGFFQTSDESLKLVIRPISVDLDKLTQLRKVYFTWNELSEKKELLLGMIALDVQKLYPELVNTDGDHLSLAYDKLSVVALKAIDELYKLIQDLLLENSKLKLLLNSLNN